MTTSTAMALFHRLSRLPVHGRYSPAAGGKQDGPQYMDRCIGAMCGLTAGHTAAAQTPVSPTVYVLVMDGAGVPTDTLGRAQEEATRVFQLSGITLVWVDAETCQVPV